MAIETEEPQAVVEEEEQEGGPVKSFLEHLEDLRWTLIKSITAASVAKIGRASCRERVEIDGGAVSFSSRRRHTRSLRDWSSDVCSSDLDRAQVLRIFHSRLCHGD